MNLEDYGLWISIRNKLHHLTVNDATIISNAIKEDLFKENLNSNQTFNYRIIKRGMVIGELISFEKNSSLSLGIILRESNSFKISNDDYNKLFLIEEAIALELNYEL